MNQKVYLEKPCEADLDQMPRNSIGTYCSLCETSVVDFSKKSLEEIHLYFRKNTGKKICGKYHNRHTQKTNTWYEFLNKIEFSISNRKLKRIAMGLIYVLLFATGCRTKKKTTYSSGRFLTKEEYQKIQTTSFSKKL